MIIENCPVGMMKPELKRLMNMYGIKHCYEHPNTGNWVNKSSVNIYNEIKKRVFEDLEFIVQECGIECCGRDDKICSSVMNIFKSQSRDEPVEEYENVEYNMDNDYDMSIDEDDIVFR